MHYGAVTKKKAKLILVWVPLTTIPHLDRAVRELDLDRSKFIRAAIREKMARVASAA
jgi:hypothetical protein